MTEKKMADLTDEELQEILDYGANGQPKKSFREILASGIEHKGGLALLAAAEEEAERRSRSTAEPTTPIKTSQTAE